MPRMPKMPQNFNVNDSLKGRKGLKDTSLQDAIERFLRHSSLKNLRQATIENYKYQLHRFYEVAEKENMPIESVRDFSAEHARLYQLRLLQDNVEYSSINLYIITCVYLWDFLVKKGYVEENIFKEIRLKVDKKEQYTPSMDEWKQVFKFQMKRAETNFVQYRNLVLFMFMSDTGARVSEAINVKRGDISLSDSFVILNTTKGRKPRRIGLSTRLANVLRDYLDLIQYVRGDYLFMSERNDQLKRRSAQAIIKEIGVKSGYPKLTCHALRRYFISVKVNAGVPLPILQRMVGHSDVTMLSHYYNLFSETYLDYKDSGIE